MKNEHRHRLQFDVAGTLNDIYPYFADLTQFGSLHPLMVDVTNQNDPSNPNRFLIREAVYLLGMIPVFPEYTADVIEVEPGNHIRYVAQVRPSVQLILDWTFRQDAHQQTTRICEDICIRSNPLTSRVLLATLKKAHNTLIENLRSELALSLAFGLLVG